jgi:hypothetical protein
MPCRHGDELPLEIERLWRTLAHNRRNIIPMLDFLASLGTHMAYQVGATQPHDEPSDAPVHQYMGLSASIYGSIWEVTGCMMVCALPSSICASRCLEIQIAATHGFSTAVTLLLWLCAPFMCCV